MNLRSNFLARFNAHFLDKGDKVFDVMLEEHPVTYFNALVQLAKVLKIEVGEAGAFDALPRPRAEALAALEEKAGPQARALFERFLKQIDQLEQAAVEGTERGERAAKAEGCEQYERAVIDESSMSAERAVVAEGRIGGFSKPSRPLRRSCGIRTIGWTGCCASWRRSSRWNGGCEPRERAVRSEGIDR
jgi:hypothetical protein